MRGSEPGTNLAGACGQSRQQGKLGTDRGISCSRLSHSEVYKTKAGRAEPRRAEPRGIGTSGQVGASGGGLEAGTKIKSKISSNSPIPPILSLPCAGNPAAPVTGKPWGCSARFQMTKGTQTTTLHYFAGSYFKLGMAETDDGLGKTWHHSGNSK